MKQAIGPYVAGYNYTVASDERRAAYAAALLERKKPGLLLVYLGSLDEIEHAHGPDTPETYAALEALDALVGRLQDAAERQAPGRATLAVVSDHGFLPVRQAISINAVLREAGLIQLDERGAVKNWQAIAWVAGGSAGIRLRQPNGAGIQHHVNALVDRLALQPEMGIERILRGHELRASGGFPDTLCVLGLRSGFSFHETAEGPVSLPAKGRGGHGFLPDVSAMDSSLFLTGPGVKSGRNLGRIDMCDIAPILAACLGLQMKLAEGRNLLMNQ